MIRLCRNVKILPCPSLLAWRKSNAVRLREMRSISWAGLFGTTTATPRDYGLSKHTERWFPSLRQNIPDVASLSASFTRSEMLACSAPSNISTPHKAPVSARSPPGGSNSPSSTGSRTQASARKHPAAATFLPITSQHKKPSRSNAPFNTQRLSHDKEKCDATQASCFPR